MRGQSLDSQSIEVTWEPPEAHLQNGILTGYKVLYTEANSNIGPREATDVTVAASEQSCTLRGLKKWTQYRIWVKAFNQIGPGPNSDLIVVQTAEDGM